MTDRLTYSEHFRAYLRLGLPIVGANLANVAIGFTDTVMLGWYSVEALAAQVLGWSVFFTIFLVGSGFSQAVMPLVAAHAEAGEVTEVRRVTRMGLWASFAFGFAMLPVLLSGHVVFGVMGQKPEIIPLASQYMSILGMSIFPGLAAMVLRSYLSALERTQVLLWVTIGAAVLNGVLDYVLIFGQFGVPEMGLTGAAIASLLMQVAMMLGLVLYVRAVAPEHRLFQRLWRIDPQALGQVVRLGVPIGATILAEVVLFSASSIMMGWLGTVPLAAHGIALQLVSLTFVVHLGIGNAGTVRVGRAQSRRDRIRQRDCGIVAVGLSLVISLLAVALFFSAPGLLAGLFIGPDEPARAEIIQAARMLIFVGAVFLTFDGLQVVGVGLLRGLQDTRVPMVIATVSYLLLGLPASYMLGFVLDLGGPGVWSGLAIGLGIAAIFLMLRFRGQVRG